MINDEKKVHEIAENIKERIVKNCNFTDALTVRKSLIQRKGQIETKMSEYTTRRDALLEKDKTLGIDVAAAISDGKNPDALSKKQREIKNEIADLDNWIAESEKLLIAIQGDEKKSIERVHQIVNAAAGQEKTLIVDELNVDLKMIEDKIEAWHAACWQLSTDYRIASVVRNIVLTNSDIRRRLP